MFTIISFKICPCYQRISALTEALNIPYKPQFLNLENPPEWFTLLSPGLEPVLSTPEGQYIVNLEPIMDFLIDNAKPSTSQFKFVTEQHDLCQLANQKYIEQCILMRAPDKSSFEEKQTIFLMGLNEVLTNKLKAPYFFGDHLSNIDIAWLPILHRAQIMAQYTRYDCLANQLQLHQWQQAIMQTGLMESSVPTDFINVFKDFYLHSHTYLGANLNQQRPKVSAPFNLPSHFG